MSLVSLELLIYSSTLDKETEIREREGQTDLYMTDVDNVVSMPDLITEPWEVICAHPGPWGPPHLKQDEKNVMGRVETLLGSLQGEEQVVTGLTFIDCLSLLFASGQRYTGLIAEAVLPTSHQSGNQNNCGSFSSERVSITKQIKHGLILTYRSNGITAV